VEDIFTCFSAKQKDSMTPVELRIEDLRHHIRVESAVETGARNAVKLLQSSKTPDKKALAEVRQNISVNSPSSSLCCSCPRLKQQ